MYTYMCKSMRVAEKDGGAFFTAGCAFFATTFVQVPP